MLPQSMVRDLFSLDEVSDPAERISVLVPYPVDKVYDYTVPAGMPVEPGDYVRVPLGGREVPGIAWGRADGAVDPAKLKEIAGKFDMPPLPQIARDFVDWVANYTMAPRGNVLKMTLSVAGALEEPKPVKGYKTSPSVGKGQKLSPKQKAVMAVMADGLARRASGIAAEAGCTPGVIKPLVEKGYLLETDITPPPPCRNPDYTRTGPVLSQDQKSAANKLRSYISSNRSPPSEELNSAGASLSSSTSPLWGEDKKGVGYRLKPSIGLRKFSKQLRTQMTEVEKKLWFALNRKQLGLKFRRQHIIGPYVVDFVCTEKKLVIELDGDQHGRDENAEYEKKRTEFLKSQGFKILRFWNYEVNENFEGVLETILHVLKSPPPTAAMDSDESKSRFPPPSGGRSGGGVFKAVLLDGVTGAGKTETYFEAVAEALKHDKQVLILLPEIALSNAFLDRFKARFGCAPALWHSNLTPAQRKRTWRGVARGESKVIVGARSALFLPYADLGLIIVDEEHDPAYKQEDGVMYHARDMAIVRASLGQFPVLLVSATPSLETIYNVWNSKYEHLHLPDRFGGARMPKIHRIDLRVDKPENRQHFIAPPLEKAMATTLERGEQVLLFLNRRGYAPLTICRACGHRMGCPRCTAWLVEHRKTGKLACHHCGYAQGIPKTCPECEEEDSFAVCGPGVERIYEEARSLFPDAEIMILASDTADDNQTLQEMLEKIRSKEVDIIVGTQIIAKGHHFPGLTCVGVIDADLGLQGGELRAAERTYQLLHQVAGRAGREDLQGHVYLQTFMPDHKIMQALADTCKTAGRNKFYEAEAFERKQAYMPPYSRLGGIIVSGRNEQEVLYIARELGRTAPHGEKIQTLGPAPAPLARLRGRYRYRLLVNADKHASLQKALKEWLAGIKPPSTVRIQIDIDPQSFF